MATNNWPLDLYTAAMGAAVEVLEPKLYPKGVQGKSFECTLCGRKVSRFDDGVRHCAAKHHADPAVRRWGGSGGAR